MSNTGDPLIFVCSFCEQTMKITPQHVGRRISCPKCTRKVLVFPNKNTDIQQQLSCTWYYRRPKLIFGSDEIGPKTDEQFVEEVRAGNILSDMEVRSPQATNNEWVLAGRIAIATVQDRVEQLAAEQKRLHVSQERRRTRDAQNLQTLYRGIATAISDGEFTICEREQLMQFARAANIPEYHVQELIHEHANKLLQSVINEAIEDGLLDPSEKQRISQLATALGVSISLTDGQSRRLHACELAWQLANGSFSPVGLSAEDVILSSNEQALARTNLCWFEIVQAKRPAGIRLDDQHSLKLAGTGDCVLTSKRITLVGQFAAKKATLSSIAQVRQFRDGVFCNRSSGKSIFLQPVTVDETWERFTLLLEHAVTDQPVLAIEPTDNFIPETSVVAAGATFNQELLSTHSHVDDVEPRYTFRVVGDHIGDRSVWIDSIRIGDPVRVVREPSNIHDCNAIAVYDVYQRQLGYLKREVAKWFAPMLDRGCSYRSQAYRKPTSGGLIVAMFE